MRASRAEVAAASSYLRDGATRAGLGEHKERGGLVSEEASLSEAELSLMAADGVLADFGVETDRCVLVVVLLLLLLAVMLVLVLVLVLLVLIAYSLNSALNPTAPL